MADMARRLIMLKPMQLGVSGYARLQSERGRLLLQLNARGLSCEGVRAFWYFSGGEVKELGRARVNPRGEAALTAEAGGDRIAPERLQALLLVDGADEPRPLMIGLCAAQSAGSLLDAKNASLSLCDKLSKSRAARAEAQGGERAWAHARDGGVAAWDGDGDARRTNAATRDGGADAGMGMDAQASAPHGQSVQDTGTSTRRAKIAARDGDADTDMDARRANTIARDMDTDAQASAPHGQSARIKGGEALPEGAARTEGFAQPDPPREIFLPAVDPLPYVTAMEPASAEKAEPEAARPKPAPKAEPVTGNGAQKTARDTARETRLEPHALQGFAPPPRAAAVDALPRLRWPEGFKPLREYFDRLVPSAVLPLPGWRFVCVSREGDGLWIGYLARDGAVRRVAYVMRGEPERDDPRAYQRVRGMDGAMYRALIQRA